MQTLWSDDSYTDWDRDMVFGCVCEPGFTGFDCSEVRSSERL